MLHPLTLRTDIHRLDEFSYTIPSIPGTMLMLALGYGLELSFRFRGVRCIGSESDAVPRWNTRISAYQTSSGAGHAHE